MIDAREDARLATNPLVLSDPNIRFYAGVPLRIDGETSPIGSLCVLDRVPRSLLKEYAIPAHEDLHIVSFT